MAKRKHRASARKKTMSKRGKVRTKAKSASRKAAKRVAVKTKAKKQATKARAKRAAPETAGPLPTQPSRQTTGASDETVIVDIIEEPVPGVVVVTEFESVRTTRPETPTSQLDEP
jgi:hypothetical protein